MKITIGFLFAVLSFGGTASAQGIGGNASLAVSTSSTRVALPLSNPSQFPSVILAPSPGTTQEIFYKLGNSTVVAVLPSLPSVQGSPALPAGGICVNIGPATSIAAIVGTGSGTLRITQVSGCTTFSGNSSAAAGSGGGSVTQGTTPWIVGGNDANGAVPTTNPIYFAGWDGTDIRAIKTDTTGDLIVGASQNGIGNVGGKTVSVCVTPTVTASNSYGTNYVVGGLLTFANAFTSTGTGVLQGVVVSIKKVEAGGFTFFPFNANPTNTTWTDAAVANINAADVFKTRTPISLGTNSQLGTLTVSGAAAVAEAVAPGTTSLYGILLANAALTNQFGSTTDVQVCVKILQDL